MNKLKSRKLWCAVASTALGVAALFFAPEMIENIEQVLVVLSPVLLYIFGQSVVDCCAAIKGKSEDLRKQKTVKTMKQELPLIADTKDMTFECMEANSNGCEKGEVADE